MTTTKVYKTFYITDDPILLVNGVLEHCDETHILDDDQCDCFLNEDDKIELKGECDNEGYVEVTSIELNGESIDCTSAVEKYFVDSYEMYDWEDREPRNYLDL